MIKKQKLRENFKNLRNNWPEFFKIKANHEILSQLTEISKNAKTIFCYVSFSSEVDTKRYITLMINAGKIVCVPKIINDTMVAIKIESLDNLKENNFGILEPTSNKIIKPKNINLVIAPCLAYNDKNFRLGYGKGFYDKFLHNIKTKKVAIAYSCQKTDVDFQQSHDIKMDLIITN